MSTNPSPDAQLQHTRQATEYVFYPPRRAIRIEDGDWERWIRTLTRIPDREPMFRDIAFACFGIAIPSLISAAATSPNIAKLPLWVSILYLVVGCTTLAVGAVCIVFAEKLTSYTSYRVKDLMQDMQDVRQRSVRSEEKSES